MSILAMLLAATAPLAGAPAAVSSPNKPTAAAEAVNIADRAAADRGDRSQVAVLGTAHLSSLPKDFDTHRFASQLDKLARWHPDRIAIESLSGAQCDLIRPRPFAYPETWSTYCPNPDAARAALGLDGPKAEAEIERILAQAGADRPAPERRRLAALFLAAGEPDSAMVQWRRLPAVERRADESLTQPLVDFLTKREGRRNEDAIIAVPLAVRLGHERLYPVDDHSGDRATGPYDEKVYGAEITGIWDNPFAKLRRADMEGWDQRLARGADVIAWYRAVNSPEQASLALAGDLAAAAASSTPARTGRAYLAYWETRNLRMAANIREVVGPGARVLAIVGASHKAYYERYLGMTSDVVLADMDRILD